MSLRRARLAGPYAFGGVQAGADMHMLNNGVRCRRKERDARLKEMFDVQKGPKKEMYAVLCTSTALHIFVSCRVTIRWQKNRSAARALFTAFCPKQDLVPKGLKYFAGLTPHKPSERALL